MNFFRLIHRLPRLVLALLLMFALCRPAHAGYWAFDRYVWNGARQDAKIGVSENTTSSGVSYGTYDIKINRHRTVLRDNTATKGSASTYIYELGLRSGSYSMDYPDTKSYPRSSPKEVTAKVNSTVYAVFKWHRTPLQLDLPQSSAYTDDPNDNPGKLYVRETITASGSKSLDNSSSGTYSQSNPWRGEYLKLNANFGSFDKGTVSAGSSSFSWTYNAYSKTKISRLKVEGDEVKVPSMTFHGHVELGPEYAKEKGYVGAGIRFAYTAEPLNLAFSLSTTPSGDSTGLIADRWYWDGSSYDARRLAPDQRNYYVVISGTITLPNAISAPATVNVTAERVRTKREGGLELVGETANIPLVLVSKSRSGSPVPNGSGSTTYTYRTHDLSDEEDLPRRVGGSQDWHINDKKGRCQFKVKDWYSNTVELKIDKRGQVTGYALEWADYYAYKRANAANEEERDKWGSTTGPNDSWLNCFTFAGRVYGRMGLTIADGDGSGMFGAATAPDEGRGSLRFFWSNKNPPTGTGDPGHVGIVGPNTYWTGDKTRIDNNGNPADSTGFNGPTWRGLDEGVGSPGYLDRSATPRHPQSRTLPAERGGTQTNGDLKSLLHELDEE